MFKILGIAQYVDVMVTVQCCNVPVSKLLTFQITFLGINPRYCNTDENSVPSYR